MGFILDNSLLYLLFPVALAGLSCYNLYDEIMVRYLHKSGVKAQGRITNVKRSLPKDRLRFLTPNSKDVSNTYDTKCDYILSLAYTPEGGKEVKVKDLIVTSMIKVSGGILFPIYKVGEAVPIRYSKIFPHRVIVDHDDVKRFQTRWTELAIWSACAVVSLFMLISMFITR